MHVDLSQLKSLFVDSLDFAAPLYGSGGATVGSSAVRRMSRAFLFVGYSSNSDHKLGKVSCVSLNGQQFFLLPIGRPKTGKRIIPDCVRFFLLLVRYYPAIKSVNIKPVFTRLFTALWFFALLPSWDICYYAPGLGNPMRIGRRPFVGKILAPLYTLIQVYALSKTTQTLAAASSKEVMAFNDILARHHISQRFISLPTAVDTSVFIPKDKVDARANMSIPLAHKVFVFTGRLADVKGVDFLLDAFQIVLSAKPNSLFLICGDGEKRSSLESYVQKLGIAQSVQFMGCLAPEAIVNVLSAADVCVVGSHTEGFSLSMVEQASCGKPIVTTDVSGASDIVVDGVNGFIVVSRTPRLFAECMIDACNLPNAEKVSRKIAINNYSEVSLWGKVRDLWGGLT